MMTNRDISISLIRSSNKGHISGRTKLFALMGHMTSEPGALTTGAELRRTYREDRPAYDALKDKQDGFVIGDFSYRSEESCIEYVPVLGFDIDKIGTYAERAKLEERLKQWPYTFLMFPSLSGFGIRLLVVCDNTEAEHKVTYERVAAKLHSLTRIPLKSSIKSGLKGTGLSGEKVKEIVGGVAHIDDTTKDTCRFWYYSGVPRSEVYINQQSKVFKYEAPKPVSRADSDSYVYDFTDTDKVEYLIDKIEATRVDITQGVTDWFKIGLALYDAFGPNGESYFYRVSQFHGDYKQSDAKTEWGRVSSKYKPNTVGIGTFYKWCSDYGVEIDFKELVHIHADKFEKAKTEGEGLPQPKKKVELPNVPEAERCTVAAVLRHSEIAEEILLAFPRFSHACFAEPLYGSIFKAAQKLLSQRLDINLISVLSKVRYDLPNITESEISQAVLSRPYYASNVLTNAKIVYDAYVKRSMIEVSEQIRESVLTEDTDAFEQVDEALEKYQQIGDYGTSQTESTLSDLAKQMVVRFDEMRAYYEKHGQTALTGVPTGLSQLDKLSLGWQKSDLIALAGRPGMGKTALLLLYVLAAALAGFKVILFSLEMSKLQLMQRLVSIYSGIDSRRIKESKFRNEAEAIQFLEANDFVGSLPIIIDDKPGITPQYMDRTVKRHKRRNGIDLAAVDYLQLMTAKGKFGSTNDKIEHISKSLKGTAKSADIPVIAISQLSRAVEIRGGSKRPQLSDLRSSGAIEQDCDMVQFVYRPEYYDILEDEEGQSLKGIAEVITAKNRHGEVTTTKCGWKAECTKFVDMEEIDGQFVEPKDKILQPQANSQIISRPSRMNGDDDIPF